MMTVTPLPAFHDNYIWTLVADGHAVVVDPGDATPVEQFIDRHALELDAILVTHHHRDHTGGIARLKARYGCAVYGPADIRDITAVPVPGETLTINAPGWNKPGWNKTALEITVLATPGHTLDHLSYYVANHLFCGDTLFGGGCGRLFEGTPQMMVESFARLLALPDATRVCCAHEYTLDNLVYARLVDPDNAALQAREHADRASRAAGRPTLPSTLALEKATNPFLRTDTPPLRAVVRHELGRPARDAAEAFGVIRAHKDSHDAAQ